MMEEPPIWQTPDTDCFDSGQVIIGFLEKPWSEVLDPAVDKKIAALVKEGESLSETSPFPDTIRDLIRVQIRALDLLRNSVKPEFREIVIEIETMLYEAVIDGQLKKLPSGKYEGRELARWAMQRGAKVPAFLQPFLREISDNNTIWMMVKAELIDATGEKRLPPKRDVLNWLQKNNIAKNPRQAELIWSTQIPKEFKLGPGQRPSKPL